MKESCYPACVRVPETVPIRDDYDLVAVVGRLCGDDVRDLLKDRLFDEPLTGDRRRLRQLIERVTDAASEISEALRDRESACDRLEEEFLNGGNS